MKRILLLLALAASLTGTRAQEAEISYKEQLPGISWVRLAPELTDQFFTTDEARRIGNNVLLYQHVSGGWPKNVYIPGELTDEQRQAVYAAKNDVGESTIDNGATSTEIRYLSRLYTATGIAKYADGALRGILYIMQSQYPNGGFPQFWPRNDGYCTHITYNDDAMVNVLQILRQVSQKQAPYSYVPDNVQRLAQASFDKGIQCILDTQVKQDGKLTVWCAQHDEKTLQPAGARAYELPSLSGQESAGIVLLLMSLPQPSEAVVTAVEAAVAWFKQTQITGIAKEYYTDEQGRRDYRMVPCPQDDYPCPPLWARFYTLEDNRPFFCDRDGIKRYDLSEIGYERRNGYSWYKPVGVDVLRAYAKWKNR